MIGEIKLFPYVQEPEGYFPLDGRELPIKDYPALYALIGTEFGGDGTHTFCLPTATEVPAKGLRWHIHALDDDFPTFD